ncbi:prenyltransferase [Thermococcus sp. P6]|uniref:prenyltransferase n=1 Tax=Thermococcus sp. P6 TaxID=122420 RepID=UPI000B5A1247|nr:prenyltransferase [Thermococcus sp. P6]ASJ10055.1 prenyltransferase [Thermococcus sp. P6]
MLAREVLASAGVIRDPYIKSVTYAKIGERLFRAKNGLYRDAFLRAIETAREIGDPFTMFRALLSVGYSMGKAGLKSSKKIYRSVMEDSRMLAAPQRDRLMESAALYMLGLGEVNEAITYALEIEDQKLRNETLLEILKVNTHRMGTERLKMAYRLRKSKLILEQITSEPDRSKALLELIKAYLLMESYEKAISLIGEMGSRVWAKQAFKEVAFYLKEKEVLGHYIGNLRALADGLIERFGSDFVVELAFALVLGGESVSALELIRRLENSGSVLVEMAMELLERDNDILPGFIAAMNEEEVVLVGKALMNRLLENPEKGSWEIVGAIGRGTANEEVWTKIARYYVLRGDLEGAMTVVRMIRDERLRSIILADVAHHLVKSGKVEDAIDVALEVKDPKFSSILVSEILIKALEKELPGRVSRGKTQRAHR